MAEITGIEYQKRRKDRVNIYLDGEFFLGLPAVVAGMHRLKVGEEVDALRLGEIAREADFEDAWTKGVDYASRSMRSVREVERYLKSKDFSDETVRETIKKLKDYGYADDAAYARAYIADHCDRGGARKLEYELRAKGVRESVFLPLLEETDFLSACERIAQKYACGREFDYEFRAKLARHLYTKGFDWDMIHDVVGRVTGGGDDD